jgi:hypothetical protein
MAGVNDGRLNQRKNTTHHAHFIRQNAATKLARFLPPHPPDSLQLKRQQFHLQCSRLINLRVHSRLAMIVRSRQIDRVPDFLELRMELFDLELGRRFPLPPRFLELFATGFGIRWSCATTRLGNIGRAFGFIVRFGAA